MSPPQCDQWQTRSSAAGRRFHEGWAGHRPEAVVPHCSVWQL